MKWAKIHIHLVPHGFQVDIEGSGRGPTSGCRDFGEDIDPSAAADTICDFLLALDAPDQWPPGLRERIEDRLKAAGSVGAPRKAMTSKR